MNPKRTHQQTQGNIGSASFELFVNRELGWIFRPVHQEYDFGIDGYIDIVESGEVTGSSLAVQLKCGKSYISKKTIGGIRYDGEIRHLNYYSNLRAPVLLVVLDEKGENGYWVQFRLDRTLPAQSSDRWWIEIPERNVLSPSVQDEWRNIAGPTFDIKDQIQKEWARHELTSLATNLVVGIEKEHVLACDTTSLLLWQDTLTKTREMMLAKRAKVEFWFQGWQDDTRELYEIKEVIDYVAATLRDGFPWIYWLEPDQLWIGYRLLYACSGKVTISKAEGGFLVNVDPTALKVWMEWNFHNLNQFTEANKIPIEINKEVSGNLVRFLKTNLIPQKVSQGDVDDLLN